MKNNFNGMAMAGFILSLCSVPLLAAAFLCLIGVMLIPFMSIVFGEMAGMLAVFGVCLSAIGSARSYREDMGGAGYSIAGLLMGTVTLTLVLAITAFLIVCAVHGTYNPMLALSSTLR